MAFCKDLGFELQLVFSDSKPSATHLTVGSVLEIFSFGKSKKMEYKSIVECIGQIVAIRDVNIQACISKIHRAASSDKKKRGKLKEEFRNETFIVPTESTSASTIASTSGCTLVSLQMPSTATLTTETKEKKVNILQTQLKERRLKVQELVQSNKLLKRKLGRRESKKCRESFQRKVEKETAVALKSVKTVQKELKVKTALLTKAQTRSKNNYSSLINANRKLKSLEHRVKSLENDKEKLDAILRKTEEEKKTICDRNKIVLKENKDLHISNDYMQGLLLDECDLHVYDHQSNTFTPELVECAMNLTNLKVATHNVGPVIREVSSLCGKIPNRLPSRTTVDNMVDRKVSLSQKQLGTVLSAKEETTLYTDETRKHGHTYQSYLITDKDKNSYLLGLREMENKSGQCTLDTMKEILKDISDYCSHSEDKEADCEPGQTVGYHILKNVCNTMSDRASTEKHFNVLLQEYRNKILPDVVYNYTNLTTQEKELCGQMNNFFCGLHLLVGIADVSEASLKKFETAYLDGKLIGSAQKPELQRYHKSESGTLRLLRTCSKAFAMGEDEKNGVFLPWKTYLGSKGEKKNHILRFKHNRFNMVFLIGQAVYYHSQDIQEFLGNVHGTSNDLLKAVLLDAKETLFLAGAKVLGLVSKFITAPTVALD
ncbi:uncharacterized protein LOC117336587 [Pecten maximus]|uniref:uncharacterized protein LOC117336587 n=1 Tax=Pecten maximus TaxID=6579 RepID=UPI001458FBEC|nr:uncharacterized protein LOC117336587 [Pecten maximus]